MILKGVMMKKPILAMLVFLLAAVTVFGFDVSVPNEVPSYKDLDIVLTLDKGMELAQARFYFLVEGNDKPLYAEFKFKEENGVWGTKIPYKYLTGEELNYFVLVQTTQKQFLRKPDFGNSKARLLKDTTPPKLQLKSPEKNELVKGKEQLVVFQIAEESAVDDFEVTYDGVPLLKAAVFKNMLYLLVSPPNDKDKAFIVISMVDKFNNKGREELSFALVKERPPFFSAETDYTAGANLEYTLAMGETANTTALGTFFSDMEHDLNLDFEVGGSAKLRAGPIGLELGLTLADDISLVGYGAAGLGSDFFDAYGEGNTLIADFQNIMNLYHPWNFDDEFSYSDEVPREFYNSNQFLAKFTIFDPILAYTFGDQKISFQQETVKDFGFRGTSFVLDTPVLDISVAKGLSDLGLYQSAWPQNFFGLKAGISALDYWWLQTNLTLISSLQGRYDSISSTGISPIGTLYDLGAVFPEENLVFGLGTGTANKLFKLSGGLGFSLYVDDASLIIDKDQLVSDLADPNGFDVDISPYMKYVDMVQEIFPILDYFPLTNGIVTRAGNRDLWGLTFGGDLEIPALGVEGWFHMTDAAYRSLGAAVDSDVMDYGVSWEKPIGDFTFAVSADRTKDNIPDILFNTIFPLVGLGDAADPTVDSISNIVTTANLAMETPPSGIFANISLAYTFEWATTNADALIALSTDSAVQTAIETSAKNDTTLTHSVGLGLKSGRIKVGDFAFTLGGKTEDAYVTYALVDGANDGSSIFELSYGVDGSVQYSRYKLNLAFANEWTTAAASDVTYAYDAKFSIQKTFFDNISIAGSFDHVFNSSSAKQYKIGGVVGLEKTMGKFSTSASLKVDFLDSMVDNAKDALTSLLTVSGGISL